MVDLPQLIVEQTYQRLLAAGVRATHLDSIAATLHISKKTIYRHFPNKTALLQKVWYWYRHRVEDQFRAFHRALTAPEELGLVLRWFREQHAALLPGFMPEVRRLAPELYQAWQQYCSTRLVQYLECNLRRGQAEGAYRPLDAEVLSRLCLAQLELLRDNQLDLAPFPLARLHHVWSDHLLRSILRADWPGGLPAH